jgi:hypothetical protein
MYTTVSSHLKIVVYIYMPQKMKCNVMNYIYWVPQIYETKKYFRITHIIAIFVIVELQTVFHI